MGPTEKKKVKVNLYDPHQNPKRDVAPGPGDYFLIESEPNHQTSVSGFNATAETYKRVRTSKPRARDRLAQRLKAPLHEVPGTIAHDISKQNKTFTRPFQVTNQDRFGESIQAKKVKDLKPPPGAYDNVVPRKRIKSVLMGKSSRSTSQRVRYRAPGPAYYNPVMIPKSISYHLNVNNIKV